MAALFAVIAKMLVAVEGCAHGCLEQIYATVLASGVPVQLLICCGDFQSVRNEEDLACLAAPLKHRQPGDFHLYYSGKKKAPILTIFIGGNHEASNYLQELPYGGWVAPNIFYLGHAGVVTIAGIRIAGLSGIYKGQDYLKGHYEAPPYTEGTKRTVYHIRNLEVFRLRQLSGDIHICLSHDWPKGIVHHGNVEQLLRIKPFFREDIEADRLGSPPCEDLLNYLRPQYWFASHMHCKFPAIVAHHATGTKTKFLALDKCLPRRRFLQILDIKHDDKQPIEIKYDVEWLTILRLTNHLLCVRPTICHMPGENSKERFNFTPTEEEKKATLEMIGSLTVPNNFEMTAKYSNFDKTPYGDDQPNPVSNTQTSTICDLLQLDDPITLIMLQSGLELKPLPSFKPYVEQTPVDDVSENETSVDTSNASMSKILSPLCLPSPRLSLPEPKNNSEEIDIDEVSANDTEETLLSDYASPPPTKKMFKRRNDSLYASNLEN